MQTDDKEVCLLKVKNEHGKLVTIEEVIGNTGFHECIETRGGSYAKFAKQLIDHHKILETAINDLPSDKRETFNPVLSLLKDDKLFLTIVQGKGGKRATCVQQLVRCIIVELVCYITDPEIFFAETFEELINMDHDFKTREHAQRYKVFCTYVLQSFIPRVEFLFSWPHQCYELGSDSFKVQRHAIRLMNRFVENVFPSILSCDGDAVIDDTLLSIIRRDFMGLLATTEEGEQLRQKLRLVTQASDNRNDTMIKNCGKYIRDHARWYVAGVMVASSLTESYIKTCKDSLNHHKIKRHITACSIAEDYTGSFVYAPSQHELENARKDLEDLSDMITPENTAEQVSPTGARVAEAAEVAREAVNTLEKVVKEAVAAAAKARARLVACGMDIG